MYCLWFESDRTFVRSKIFEERRWSWVVRASVGRTITGIAISRGVAVTRIAISWGVPVTRIAISCGVPVIRISISGELVTRESWEPGAPRARAFGTVVAGPRSAELSSKGTSCERSRRPSELRTWELRSWCLERVLAIRIFVRPRVEASELWFTVTYNKKMSRLDSGI